MVTSQCVNINSKLLSFAIILLSTFKKIIHETLNNSSPSKDWVKLLNVFKNVLHDSIKNFSFQKDVYRYLHDAYRQTDKFDIEIDSGIHGHKVAATIRFWSVIITGSSRVIKQLFQSMQPALENLNPRSRVSTV